MKVVISSGVSSRMGRNRSVGLCGSKGLAGLYGSRRSNRMRAKLNLCPSVDKDEFSLTFVVIINLLINVLFKR